MTEMDRRSFLRMLAAVAVTPLVPSADGNALVPAEPMVPLNPLWEGGEAIDYHLSAMHLSAEEHAAFREHLARDLVQMARAKLPKGRRFDIRAKLPGDYGRRHGMAWYTNDFMQTDPKWEISDICQPVYLPGQGYCHVASLLA
jgi:hypothetical protein